METAERTITEKIIRSFCAHDDCRPSLLNPGLVGGYIYASDGHRLIRINEVKSDFKPETHPKFPDVLGVWNKILPNEDFQLHTQLLKDAIEKVPLVESKYDCDNCEGTGTHNCRCCGHKSECAECDGKGKFVSSNKFELDAENYQLIIKGVAFNPSFLNDLLTICLHKGQDYIHVRALYPGACSLFIIGEFEIGIMPMIFGGVEKNMEQVIVIS